MTPKHTINMVSADRVKCPYSGFPSCSGISSRFACPEVKQRSQQSGGTSGWSSGLESITPGWCSYLPWSSSSLYLVHSSRPLAASTSYWNTLWINTISVISHWQCRTTNFIFSAYAYNRSKINKKIHATAIHFVIMSVALLQLIMIVFSVIRSLDPDSKTLNLRSKVAIGLFILTLNVSSAQIWSNTCRKISPIMYCDVLLADDPNDGHDEVSSSDRVTEIKKNSFSPDLPSRCTKGVR